MRDSELIPIGTRVPPWGKLCAVGNKDGERYYMFINKHGDVALIPSTTAEQRYRALNPGNDL